MCNEYARQIALAKLQAEFSRTRLPMFSGAGGRIPNDLDGRSSVRIREAAPVFRLEDDQLVGEMIT